MRPIESFKELQKYEKDELTEKHGRRVATFGLAFPAQAEIDKQRFHNTRRLGGLSSSHLSLELLENRLESIDWTDMMKQPAHETQMKPSPYRIIQEEMV